MPKYSKTSLERLATCHPDIQRIFKMVIKSFDHSILCGRRPKSDQDRAYSEGRSKVRYPDSTHNKTPSDAVDAAPYPINWKNTKRFYYFGGFVMGIAFALGIKLRWGGDWDMDTEVKDNTFNDLVHFEKPNEKPK